MQGNAARERGKLMATFREVLVKIFCAKRYATREEAMQARLEARAHRRSRRRSYGPEASGNGALSRSMGAGFGMPGPKNNYGFGPGPGF
jgi:hypothetical protein